MEHVLDDGMSRSMSKPQKQTISLSDINEPQDLRALDVPALVELAVQIRELLVTIAATKGGHFAPSLGTVELTLALHYVFDTPNDLLVWDVGHQAYVHKLLTGRREQLSTIRQYNGLSGFLKRSESPYDTFGAGHASTAPSAALGMATACALQGRRRKTIAVIGDGAMTGGLAFEALNNAGAQGRDMVVVLNDNAMSISPNVGAVAHYLTSLTTHPYYRRMKEEIATVLSKLPQVGGQVRELAKRLEHGIKGALVPGALFESLGFRYLGPIDGHDLTEMVDVMQRVKEESGPVLLHVLTHKGKGYAPAEADPLKWHGVTPFDPQTGRTVAPAAPKSLLPSYTQVFGQAVVELATRHDDVIAITAAMSPGTGLTKFEETFPKRFFDVGIAEGHGVTFAAGLATQGLRPICAIYSTFLQRAFDHIIHDVAIQELPVIFALDRGGVVGADGPTHHGCFDLAYLRLIPGMVVSAPRDADELADLLETAYAHTTGPFAIRYPREDSPRPRTRAPKVLPIGSWELVVPGNRELTFLAVGTMLPLAEAVAERLRGQGLDPTVVNARFVKPMDLAMLREIDRDARLVVTLEEGTLRGGFGSGVHETSVEQGLSISARLMSCGISDEFVTHGSRQELLRDLRLTVEDVSADVLARWSKLDPAR
jgi:1-deoxy-D-xylulose-5-phosphate synthase